MNDFDVFLSGDTGDVSGYADPSEDAPRGLAAAMADDDDATVRGAAPSRRRRHR
ncbi:hypothetical protein [Haloarchaeobius sp. FL176]|uniref:hypothetical protein n=1 Tax=Haloarchaeobius sp. FL176 TaxID=2967129 RepID=UPI00214876A9|nr:hypothetical protein [Haloarchaeobius sp. FL176]